jgi:hypothetical protein
MVVQPWLWQTNNQKSNWRAQTDLCHMHGRFLEESAELYTNRGVGQATGLFMCSLFFPELKEAEGWGALSKTRMENVLKHDFLSDRSYK